MLVGFVLMLVESAAALGVPWLGGRFAATLLASTPAEPLDGLGLVLMGLLWLFAVQALARDAARPHTTACRKFCTKAPETAN